MKVEKAINYVLYPNSYKKSPKSGKTPLYVRIIAGEKVEWTTGISVSDSELLKWNKSTNRINEKHNTTNDDITKYESQLQLSLAKIQDQMPLLKAKDIKALIVQEKSRKCLTIIGYTEEYFVKNVQNKDEFAKGTKKNYQKAINHLRAFIINSKLSDLGLHAIDYSFANDFKNYLTDSVGGRKGMCENSASGIIKKFRTIFNQAVNYQLISTNPFIKIKLKEIAKAKTKLNAIQIKALYYSKNLTYSQQVATDIFLFSVFTGLSYSDAQRLDERYVTTYFDDKILLDSSRVKTDKIFSFFLPKLALEIINRYKGTHETIKGNLIPSRTNKQLNQKLEVLGLKAGIGFHISSHHARHSFRSLCGEAEFHDNSARMKMMGLSLGKDMDKIYDYVTEERLWKAKEKIDLYLEKTVLHETK